LKKTSRLWKKRGHQRAKTHKIEGKRQNQGVSALPENRDKKKEGEGFGILIHRKETTSN